MTHSWFKSVLPIAAIFSFRMLGLFMLIPVFTIYAVQLNHATPLLIGIALGSYGLSQGLLQIPFGILSDRFGRKPILTFGLILFVAGSVLGALAHSIYGMIIARILQGAGAIGSVLIALLADLTPDKTRVKAMAVIGVTIGLSFCIAMVISPSIAHHYGLSGIFFLTMILAIAGLLLLHMAIPSPPKEPFSQPNITYIEKLRLALKNPHLQRLNVGIFCQHAILTSTFFVIPTILQQHIALHHLSQQWHFYLPLMLTSFICMLPFIRLAEKKQHMKVVFLGSILTTALIQLLLATVATGWLSLCGCMFAYFVAFNILEASLPSLVSRHAHLENKGTAMGIYSSSQFLGIFVGGLASGLIYSWGGNHSIFIMNGLIALLWLWMSLNIQPNAYELTLILHYTKNLNTNLIEHKLSQIPGVQQVQTMSCDKIIYLRIDKARYQEGQAEKILAFIQNEESEHAPSTKYSQD